MSARRQAFDTDIAVFALLRESDGRQFATSDDDIRQQFWSPSSPSASRIAISRSVFAGISSIQSIGITE
jgi:hypothetical protein